ncbi:LOW QUALITY PROTEIN: IQ domain-containing protein M [Eudromia elegans]
MGLKIFMIDSQANKMKRAVSKVKPERKSSDRHLDLQTQKKVKRSEAHLKDYEAFHDSTMHPNIGEVLNAVICIQRYVRAWLQRRTFKRIKIKATSHGLSLPRAVRQYRKMMTRIRRRAGVLHLSTPLRYFELEEWLDKKKFYEKMFDKRQFCEEMDRNDLPGFFKDCGYFIPPSGIQRVLQMVCPSLLCTAQFSLDQKRKAISTTSTAPLKSIKKDQAIEMAFTLFPPLGSHVKNIITVPPPWVFPIIQGKDVSKNSAFILRKLKKADFRVSAALVSSSMREGKEKHLSDQDCSFGWVKSSWCGLCLLQFGSCPVNKAKSVTNAGLV